MRDLIMFETNGEQLWLGREQVELKSEFYARQLKQLNKLSKDECNFRSLTYLTGLVYECYN